MLIILSLSLLVVGLTFLDWINFSNRLPGKIWDALLKGVTTVAGGIVIAERFRRGSNEGSNGSSNTGSNGSNNNGSNGK
ncbi:hypothetical protein AGABI1DRAFT_134673 [Agaricus bisporus var. burnettii JB137-S8]|uniref:Uncharacterized protein n=1 Tax=Agaricus bisporus var. burnettii (strain JB137-S8 / ATCC MYA-4627 / FGSC 10392) TaxID=597362 RepID=K5XGG4_AGABU|nr:uncharacterized protein AGABI1DRAFT_134673 [Agaricus bisporus var. burnettii JB137-S8]EKM73490.1 hypothetical protein AGABI1DRAFT_134673 [Agaricus bisporus var. burnettii JB137-S8]